MKQFRLLLVLCAIQFFASKQSAAQLNAGDIAFTGYVSSATNVDTFSFVLLVAIPSGTQISFTDNAWLTTNAFRAGEQHLTWTAGQNFPAGREITICGTSSPTPLTPTSLIAFTNNSAGTCTGQMVSLNTSGDQIIAYQGTVASPTVIAGIHMNVYAVTGVGDCANTTTASWDPPCVDGAAGTVGNGNWCSKPPALTTGTNAIWIGTQDVTASEEDWGVFNCTGPLATPAQVRLAVNNPANWITGDGLAGSQRTNPSRCTFLGLAPLPIRLDFFGAQLNSDKTVSVKWKVSEQQDVVSYIVEKSTDGNNYSEAGVVFPSNTDNYTLLDPSPVTGKNYYRLRIKESSGKITYSQTVIVSLKAGIVISLYPNPVSDKLTIQSFGTIQNKTAILADAQGRILQQIRITNLQQTVNMERYAAGIYTLRLEDGSSFKIVKE